MHKFFSSTTPLKYSFIIGGIYDIINGMTLLFFVDILVISFGLNKPIPFIFGQLSGILLIVVGYFLLIATRDINHYAFIGFGSVIVRFGYFLYSLVGWLNNEHELIYLFFGLTDLITGLIILLPLLFTQDLSLRKVVLNE